MTDTFFKGVPLMKKGVEVFVINTVPNPAIPEAPVTPDIPCTVRMILDNVVMILPHNSGHEVITRDTNLRRKYGS